MFHIWAGMSIDESLLKFFYLVATILYFLIVSHRIGKPGGTSFMINYSVLFPGYDQFPLLLFTARWHSLKHVINSLKKEKSYCFLINVNKCEPSF